MTTKVSRYRFDWSAGHQFRLLVDGLCFFERMLATVARARRYVLLEMYLFESGQVAGRFVAALCRQTQRGVSVYLLLDDYGARGLRRIDRQRLESAGVHLCFYNPLRVHRHRHNLFRNHRKLLQVDGEVAFTGGMGITDEFEGAASPWHEVVIEIRGPSVRSWQSLFEGSWKRWARHEMNGSENPLQGSDAAGGQLGRVVHGTSMRPSEVVRSLVTHMRKAQTRVWLSSAYFVPPWKVRRALRRSARKGVDVRLMVPGPNTDHPGVRYMGRRYYERLLRNGVKIYEYQPRFLHAKFFLCDNWCSIGSTNLDRWGLRWNLEANQEVVDSEFARKVEGLFEEDFSRCRRIHYEQWQRRPLHFHFLEWFWGKVIEVLAWLSAHGKRAKRRRRKNNSK